MKVSLRTPVGIAAVVVALLAVGCGKNFDTENREDMTVTLDSGTVVEVRPLTNLSPVTEETGDEFTATLASPLMKGDQVVAPQGTTVMGQVVEAKAADPGAEGSFLALQLRQIVLTDGDPITINTESVRYAPSESHEKVEGVPAPAVVPADTIVTFHLTEPVEVKVAIDQNEEAAAPIS